jgi:hypothetical protein
MEAMRCLKHRISDGIYRQLIADQQLLAHRADAPEQAPAHTRRRRNRPLDNRGEPE